MPRWHTLSVVCALRRCQRLRFLSPPCQSIIDLDGPVGMVLTADRNTREPAITQTQPAHYPWAHDNSCLVRAQGRGCSCTRYVTGRRVGGRGGESSAGRDVSRSIIVHRANRRPVTHSGWGLLSTDSSILSVVSRRGILVVQRHREWSMLGLRKLNMCYMSSSLVTCYSYCFILEITQTIQNRKKNEYTISETCDSRQTYITWSITRYVSSVVCWRTDTNHCK